MQRATPLPARGEVFLDARGGARTMRVSWHSEAGVVVLSLWREGHCACTFRLPVEDVPAFIEVLRSGLSEAYDQVRTGFAPHTPTRGDLAV
jgi:hypothetical protein